MNDPSRTMTLKFLMTTKILMSEHKKQMVAFEGSNLEISRSSPYRFVFNKQQLLQKLYPDDELLRGTVINEVSYKKLVNYDERIDLIAVDTGAIWRRHQGTYAQVLMWEVLHGLVSAEGPIVLSVQYEPYNQQVR